MRNVGYRMRSKREKPGKGGSEKANGKNRVYKVLVCASEAFAGRGGATEENAEGRMQKAKWGPRRYLYLKG